VEAHGHNYCCGGPGPLSVKLTVMNGDIYLIVITEQDSKLHRSRYISLKNIVTSGKVEKESLSLSLAYIFSSFCLVVEAFLSSARIHSIVPSG